MIFSERIKLLASYVKNKSNVLDIGTDHGYLPLYLIQNKITTKITLTDINLNPLLNAKKTLADFITLDSLKFIQTNGFTNIDNLDIYDFIIIAGLGGKKISEIIFDFNSKSTLILNPTNGDIRLRKFLMENNFEILDENLIIENKIYSLVIIAKKINKKIMLTTSDLILGPILKQKENEIILNYYNQKAAYFKNLFKISKNLKHKELADAFSNLK